MRGGWAAALPSAGIWLIVTSWMLLAVLVLWGLREPRLDRMRRELQTLATVEGLTASDWLVREVELELGRRPRFALKLAGESGARPLEARRDGSTRSSRFHLALTPKVERLVIRGQTEEQLELTHGDASLTVSLVAGRAQRLPVPEGWRRGPTLITVTRGADAGELLITGDLGEELP